MTPQRNSPKSHQLRLSNKLRKTVRPFRILRTLENKIKYNKEKMIRKREKRRKKRKNEGTFDLYFKLQIISIYHQNLSFSGGHGGNHSQRPSLIMQK
jgi:hypothetical protein